MATLIKTGTGTWKAVVRKQGWPTVSKTFRTKRDAQDWSRRTEDEIVRGAYVDRSRGEQLTLADAMSRYLREVTPGKAESTQSREILRTKHLLAKLGKHSLVSITPDVVANYRDERLQAGKSASTVRLELALLGHLFTIALKEWRLGLVYNPVSSIRRPPPHPGRQRRLAADEEQRILAVADQHSNPMFGWIIRIAIQTSMRSGETSGIKLAQVDLERRVIRLPKTKNGGARTVPLNREATRLLKLAMANPLRHQDSDLLFPGRKGRDGKRRPYAFSRQWALLRESLGIEDLKFHDLRHEGVSRLVEGGLSDQEVAAVSGHKSMQMVRRYTHLRAEDLVAKLDAID